MASPTPDAAVTRISRDVAWIIGGCAGLSVALVLLGLLMGWMGYHIPTSRVFLYAGEGVMVAAPLAGLTRLVFSVRSSRRLALSALGTLAVVAIGVMLALPR